jgi:hypothetical protein
VKTEYKAGSENCTISEMQEREVAHECPTSHEDENVLQPSILVRVCDKCKVELSIKDFYYRKAYNLYYKNCKKCYREKIGLYAENNKPKISEMKKRYYEKNRDGIKARKKTHNIDLEKKRANRRLWENSRLATDVEYKLRSYLRSRIRKAIKSQKALKSSKTVELLGCSVETLRLHLESKFSPGMTWDNYGKWHIDHIHPLSKTNLSNPQELLRAMNYKNLQPLWAIDNIKKGAKIEN